MLRTNQVAVAVVVLEKSVGRDGGKAILADEVVNHVDVTVRMPTFLVLHHNAVELEIKLTAKASLYGAGSLGGEMVEVSRVFPWTVGRVRSAGR